jgi:hypothetical protein
MSDPRSFSLECSIQRGAFSDERIVSIPNPGGEAYVGIASRQYCWKENDTPLGETEPNEGETIEGKVAARVIKANGSGKVLVSIPDGEVIAVRPEQLKRRPQGVSPSVPV